MNIKMRKGLETLAWTASCECFNFTMLDPETNGTALNGASFIETNLLDDFARSMRMSFNSLNSILLLSDQFNYGICSIII